MAVDLNTTRKISEAQYNEIIKNGEMVEVSSAKGYGISLHKGDVVTFGDIFLTTMGKALVSEEKPNEWNRVYWVSATSIKRGELTLVGDVADAMFARSGKLFPSNEEEITNNGKTLKNLAGAELYAKIMSDLKLKKEQMQFNLQLSSRQESRDRLRSLKGNTLDVIASKTVYTKKFNSKNEENWGSKREHWTTVDILFFELKK
jgi:hypothetical protein